jgi:beta-lactamase superfamily II metal-dependent hydrolase
MVQYRVTALLVAAVCLAWQGAPKTLDVQLIDVEGGKAVLVVTPAGESMLFDAGWDATRGASTDRLVDAVQAAGLKQIDYLVISHYDIDHLGDVPKLAEKIPIRHLVDHGPYEFGTAATKQRYAAYAELYRTIPHIEVKPGDRIPLKGIQVDVVSAAGNLITKPVNGGGAPNPLCATNPQQDEITSNKEDNSSVGLLFTYGRFRMLDLADLEAYKDHDLVCPANLLGTVDVYQVNVHGQIKGMAPELVGAVHPRVAMMGNGSRKGADLATWPVLRGIPGLEDIWQVHYSTNGGKENNPPDDFIANLELSAPPNDQWKMLKLSASPDGGFTITNQRNGFHKTYPPHQ